MTTSKNTEQATYKQALIQYSNTYILQKRDPKAEGGNSTARTKYVIYARKSTEDDKRQVQSIEDQVDHCKNFAKKENLDVIDILREEKSAKNAGKRNIFNLMLESIYKGDSYNAILSWHPDRLSRNMRESGEILDMLDNNYIRDLKFPSYAFNNDAAGKMTLSILFAMAKEFSDKLSEDTKRGISRKVSEGKHSGGDKRGYIVGKDDYFRPHPDTFEVYKKAWELYAETNNKSHVLTWLNEQG
jgi:DNA invertase Pin-like site-specific DNA recombinase